MSFLRFNSEIISASVPKKTSRRRKQLGLLTLCSLGGPAMAQAKPFRAVGVKAWTSGSETFIRARPSAEVPPVAKVARHTPLYVWGKYNGWYRVETHDHIFGWVYNEYIEAPKDYKVRAMPEFKARLASNRTANQTMYGSPELLKKHYVAFGAPGALKGLQKQGIRLASASKTHSAAPKPRIVLANGMRPVAAKVKAPRIAESKPATTKVAASRPSVRIASAPRVTALPPRVLSPVPSAERLERRVRVAPVAEPVTKPGTISSKPPVVMARTPRVVVKSQPARNLAPALTRKSGDYKPPRVENLTVAPPLKAEVAAAPRAVESDKISDSARGLTPSAKFFARAASDAASRPSPRLDVASQSPASGGAPSTHSASEPIPFKPAVSLAPVAPRVQISSPAPKRVAKKPAKKVATRRSTRGRYASRRDRQREQLRAKMGLSTSAPRSVIAPVSASELMRARQDYLAERKARLGLPSVPAGEVPVVGLAPLPIPSGPLGGPSDTPAPLSSTPLPPAAPTGFAPMSFEPTHPLAPLLGNPYILSLAQLRPKNAPELRPVGALKPMPLTTLTRGGSPRDRMAPLRGGSPRDRFGSGMANQALSYRGMPYIRGAASPNRGFDCSGLVYYLLTQRGYHPPRTAAGYANWGQSIPKNQLKSGDLLLFANTYKRGISHIGVYLGEGKFVHAATSSTGVRVSSLNEAYYRGKYFGARRAK